MKLIIYDIFDYADEFDYPVFSILTLEQQEALIEAYSDHVPSDFDNEFYFGANEFLTFTKEELIKLFRSAKPISSEELAVLQKYGLENLGLDIVEQATETACDYCPDLIKSAFNWN